MNVFRRRLSLLSSFVANHPVFIGLFIRLLLVFALPSLLDDGLLLRGVRYTDIDYKVFTDAARHIAEGRSPYDRHTYRYTPFLASLLALPMGLHREGTSGNWWTIIFSTRYFGKILFSLADVACGYIVIVLRRRGRRRTPVSSEDGATTTKNTNSNIGERFISKWWHFQQPTTELIDALWWIYNPLPINICTRGSAESLVVLLPVLATVIIATSVEEEEESSVWKFMTRASLAGLFHGIGIHAKLYPVIYTVSFMANFAYQEQRMYQQRQKRLQRHNDLQQNIVPNGQCSLPGDDKREKARRTTFPWRHPGKIARLAMTWFGRLFFSLSSMTFFIVSMGTVGILTYLAVRIHGREALDEGLLYHFKRVDHRHNYSMYWYWIYLAWGRAAVPELGGVRGGVPGRYLGLIPLVPQILILGFISLGIAPYDLTFALFCQTFSFVAFNKVITAQYFTWYLCLLPLCSTRIRWHTKRMYCALGVLGFAIVTWLLSAFTLEMLGWRAHLTVWMASVLFFIANVNLKLAIVDGYKGLTSRWGEDRLVVVKEKVKLS